MRLSLHHFAVLGLAIGWGVSCAAQAPALASAPKPPTVVPTLPAHAAHAADEATNPVADPKAIVTLGNARFTVLTPQLIRMEWAADGKFEDHASFVFLNRHSGYRIWPRKPLHR